MSCFIVFQEDVTPTRVVEIVEQLRRGEKPPVRTSNWSISGLVKINVGKSDFYSN